MARQRADQLADVGRGSALRDERPTLPARPRDRPLRLAVVSRRVRSGAACRVAAVYLAFADDDALDPANSCIHPTCEDEALPQAA